MRLRHLIVKVLHKPVNLTLFIVSTEVSGLVLETLAHLKDMVGSEGSRRALTLTHRIYIIGHPRGIMFVNNFGGGDMGTQERQSWGCYAHVVHVEYRRCLVVFAFSLTLLLGPLIMQGGELADSLRNSNRSSLSGHLRRLTPNVVLIAHLDFEVLCLLRFNSFDLAD